MIAACEERYRQIYKQEDENIQINFPKHYPTSALIGYVDVVDVLPNYMLSECNIPHTVHLNVYLTLGYPRRRGITLCIPMSELSCIFCMSQSHLEINSSFLFIWRA